MATTVVEANTTGANLDSITVSNIDVDAAEVLLAIFSGTSGGQTFTDVTFNGVTLANLLGGTNFSGTFGNQQGAASISMGWVVPGDVTANLVTSVNASMRHFNGYVIFAGADTTTPFGSEVEASGTGTAVDSGTVAGSSGDLAVMGVHATAPVGANDFTPDGGVTEEYEVYISSGGGHTQLLLSTPGGASAALGGDWGTAPTEWAGMSFNVAQAAGAAAVFAAYYQKYYQEYILDA